MNRLGIIAVLMCLATSLSAQPLRSYSVVSLMNGSGSFHTDTGSVTLPVWGYGINQFNPFVTLPGPTIYANEGDSVHLEMINPSMEGHTIHLHGLDVDEANDGVPHHTGFIQEGESFTYKFKATHAGNFLYHCHVTTTMHLALGMYGMVIVYPADSSKTIYDGGPTYDRQHAYLLSEMDARWNKDYTKIGSFLSYDPDLFLIDGKNRSSIYSDTNLAVYGAVGEKHLLRFMNVGYRVNRVIFPDELDAVVHTSDGRVLSSSFDTDTLIVYPGERFSVLAEITDETPSQIAIDWLDPYLLEFIGREYIPVNDSSFTYIEPSIDPVDIDTIGVGQHKEPLSNDFVHIYPNPASKTVVLASTTDLTSVKFIDMQGRIRKQVELRNRISEIGVDDLDAGYYVVTSLNGTEVLSRQRLLIMR